MNAQRLVLAFGLPSIALVATVLTHEHFFGQVEFVAVAPASADLEVQINDEEWQTILAGERFERKVAQGDYRVRLRSAQSEPREYRLTVDRGSSDFLFPATFDQCWVAVDVFGALYEAALEEAPEIEARWGALEPIVIDSAYHFAFEDLPAQSRGRTLMIHPISCALHESADEELLSVLGYGLGDAR